MKKVLIVCLAAGLLAVTGCKKKSPPAPVQPEQAAQPRQTIAEMVEEGSPQPLGDQPQLPPADQLGEKVTFELAYRSITGKEDDFGNLGGWGFGSSSDDNSFISAVREQTKNKLFISSNHYLKDRQLTAVEYKGKEVLHAYFDLNADGQLSADEILSPVEVSQRVRRGDSTVFMTPDFMLKNTQDQPTPFSVLLWVHFYGDSKVPNVTWSPIGLYEGTADMNGSPVKLYLLPDFGTKSYTQYARSRYALIPASHDMKQYIRRNTFSSIIVQDSTFYRVVVEEISPLAKTLKVSLIEDKTPRGKIALNIQGKEAMKHRLSSANIRGSEDKTVYFQIGQGMNELPVGSYEISYGSFQYGKETLEEYYTSFRNIPAFSMKADQETTIEVGKPEVKLQAVELSKRYHSDKQYKTEFPEGTEIYIDAAFVGLAKETYSSFDQRVKKEDYWTHETMKARIKIVDAQGNEIANQELEYG